MQELELTWRRTMSVWWLMVWRGMVGGALLGGIAGFVGGFANTALGGSLEMSAVIGQVLGLLVGLIWSFFIVRMAFKKKYGEFRVALIAHSAR